MKYVGRISLYNTNGYKLKQNCTAEKQNSGFLLCCFGGLHLLRIFSSPPHLLTPTEVWKTKQIKCLKLFPPWTLKP